MKAKGARVFLAHAAFPRALGALDLALTVAGASPS
jgi:hypothetical protein